jgi:hypothetical protein
VSEKEDSWEVFLEESVGGINRSWQEKEDEKSCPGRVCRWLWAAELRDQVGARARPPGIQGYIIPCR